MNSTEPALVRAAVTKGLSILIRLAFYDLPTNHFRLRGSSQPSMEGVDCGSEEVPGCEPLFFFHGIEWSASWNPWNKTFGLPGAPQENTCAWGISLRISPHACPPEGCGQDVAFVDVTPRRLQQFEVDPSQSYNWFNFDFAKGQIIQSGIDLAPDPASHLLTVPAVRVGSPGNHLVIFSSAEGSCF